MKNEYPKYFERQGDHRLLYYRVPVKGAQPQLWLDGWEPSGSFSSEESLFSGKLRIGQCKPAKQISETEAKEVGIITESKTSNVCGCCGRPL